MEGVLRQPSEADLVLQISSIYNHGLSLPGHPKNGLIATMKA